MPAIASLEDLKAARKDLLEAKDLNELKAVFKEWPDIYAPTTIDEIRAGCDAALETAFRKLNGMLEK